MIVDFVQLQNDMTQTLLAAWQLSDIAVFQLRLLRLQSEVDEDMVCLQERNGKSGCGILVEMPSAEVRKPNVPGPELTLICTMLVVEQPSLNLAPLTGTQMTAEDVCQHILDIFHQWQVDDMGAFYAAGKPFEPVQHVSGTLAYRVRFNLTSPRQPTVRLTQPAITENAGTITLTNSANNLDAEIYWTADGSFPAQPNPAATKYSGPFPVNTGDTVRWACYSQDKLQSDVGSAVVS